MYFEISNTCLQCFLDVFFPLRCAEDVDPKVVELAALHHHQNHKSYRIVTVEAI